MTIFSKLGGLLMTCALASTVGSTAFADDGVAVSAPTPAPVAPTARVTVVLRADTPRATLERPESVATYAGVPFKDAAIAGLATWVPECTAPCETNLDTKYTYRVGGDGLVPSDSFVLPHAHDGAPLVVDAQMGSAFGRVGGIGLSVIGAGGLVLGATAMAVTPILADDNVGTSGVRTGVLVSGIAVTALSAVVFGAGLWLWNHNETTMRPNPARGFTF